MRVVVEAVAESGVDDLQQHLQNLLQDGPICHLWVRGGRRAVRHDAGCMITGRQGYFLVKLGKFLSEIVIYQDVKIRKEY